MSNHPDTSQTDVPLSPEVERIRRKLMRLMMVTLIVTFMLVAAVLIAVIYKATRQPTQAGIASPPASLAISTEYELDLDALTILVSHVLNDPIIAFETIKSDGNREFIFYDYRDGRVISRLKIPPHLE